jgi:hypothetical protein
VLKRVAVKLSKTCNDLRLLSSGPRAGLGEINLPPVQAGSSIMPGKVNPVIPEVVNQIAFEVIGNDVTVSLDIVYDVGSYVVSLTREGKPLEIRGKYVVVWKKEQGEWVVVVDIDNADHPL